MSLTGFQIMIGLENEKIRNLKIKTHNFITTLNYNPNRGLNPVRGKKQKNKYEQKARKQKGIGF